MNTRRTLITKTLVPAGAAALLAACGGASQTATQKVDLTKVNRKLLVWTDNNAGRKAIIERWSKTYPNLPAEGTDIGSGGQGSEAITKFLAAVAAGDVADVVRFDRFQIGSYTHRGAFTQLDQYQKADKYDLKRFVESANDECHSLDGKLYGIPNSTDNRPFFWSKMAFREIGVDAEKPPATWDQLKEYALKLNRQTQTGYTRMGFTYGMPSGLSGSSLTYLWGFLNQAEFTSKDGKKAQLNHPKVIEAMQWMYELLEAEGGTQKHEDFKKTFGSNENHPLFAQQVAMGVMGHSFLGTIARYAPQYEFGIGPNPARKAGDQSATWSGGFAWIVPKGVKNPEISWEMIKDFVSEAAFLFGYEAEKAQSGNPAYIPGMSAQSAVDKVAFEKFKSGIPAVDKGLAFAVDYMKQSRFRPVSPAGVELYDGANTAWNAVLAKQKSVKQAYDDVNAVAQAALDQAYASVGTK